MSAQPFSRVASPARRSELARAAAHATDLSSKRGVCFDCGWGEAAVSVTPVSSSSLLTADDLAERWRVSKAQVYRLAREGRVPTVLIGRYYRFRLAAIEAWELEQEGASDD